jgi:hypothetical protein
MDKTIGDRGKDKWEENKVSLFKLCNENGGKIPSTHSKNDTEKKLGIWYNSHITKIKSVDDKKYKKLAENDHVKKAMDMTLLKRTMKT